MSEKLGVMCVEMVSDGKQICCLNGVLSVDDKRLWAYYWFLWNAVRSYLSCQIGLESLFATCVIWMVPFKSKFLDSELLAEYIQKYVVVNGVEGRAQIQQHQSRHKTGVTRTDCRYEQLWQPSQSSSAAGKLIGALETVRTGSHVHLTVSLPDVRQYWRPISGYRLVWMT